jgi:H+/Cl- antiporter ClcA
MQNTGKFIVLAGIVLVVIGLIIWLFGDKFQWLGNLPGDFKAKGENWGFYAPIASMLLLSLAFSGLLWLLRKIGQWF